MTAVTATFSPLVFFYLMVTLLALHSSWAFRSSLNNANQRLSFASTSFIKLPRRSKCIATIGTTSTVSTPTHPAAASASTARMLTTLFLSGQDDEQEETAEQVEMENGKNKGRIMSLLRFLTGKANEVSVHDDTSISVTCKSSTTTAAATKTSATKATALPHKETVQLDPPTNSAKHNAVVTPMEEATRLLAEAERIRLEAERMDAELTLHKIERLEKELTSAKLGFRNDSRIVDSRTKNIEQLQQEINALLSKVSIKSSNQMSSTNSTTDASKMSEPTLRESYEPAWPKYIKSFNQEVYDELYQTLKDLPTLILAPLALTVGVEPIVDTETGKNILNVTEVAIAIDKIKRFDFSMSRKAAPRFTKEQIAEAVAKISEPTQKGRDPKRWFSATSIFSDNEAKTELFDDPVLEALLQKYPIEYAQLMLEFEYYVFSDIDFTDDNQKEKILSMISDQPLFAEFLNMQNGTLPSVVDNTISAIYPKCTTKKDYKGPMKIPTEAQVNQLITEVLPHASFQSTSKAEPVLGGFIIRGSTSFENGDEFIAKLNHVLEKTSLRDKMTVLYAPDFVSFAKDEEWNPFAGDSPILYIVGPEICRESRPIQLSIVSGLGLATAWYSSIFPFLLNPTIADRVDELLALADAGMTPDLLWLTELSVPLFATFMSIQFAHELGHLIMAGANDIESSVPTFVPSIITGMTSTVTTFKSPPKNKAAMFDFSIAGPLAGMVASVAALIVGAHLTVTTDGAMFPALPLEVLRQSTLGGGILEFFLGNDVFFIPPGARGTAAVNGMTVALHPVALAGYFGLVVNALALVPIGTTDGGRVAITLFGRMGKATIGSLFFLILLIAGLSGSDPFLFYVSFCLAFQVGNEIPARNEVAKIDISRVLLATAVYVFVALALIPF